MSHYLRTFLFLKLLTISLISSNLFAQTSSLPEGIYAYNNLVQNDTTMGSQGYFWGLDGDVSNVSAKGDILQLKYSITSLGKAISRPTLNESKFGQNFFMLENVTSRKYHIFVIGNKGYVYPKHIDFGQGIVSSVNKDTWGKTTLYAVPEIIGDRIRKIGGKFFVTKRGYVGTFGNQGELYIHTKTDEGEKQVFKNIKIMGGNYFLTKNGIFTVSVDGKVLEKQEIENLDYKDVKIAGGNYILTKEGRLFTMANFQIEGSDSYRVKIEQHVPLIKPEVLLKPYFHGGTFLSYRKGIGASEKNFVLAITHSGKPVMTGWKCVACEFDYNGDGEIEEDEMRDFDYGKVPPKVKYDKPLIGHNYVVFAEGTIWTINDRGRVKMAIRLDAKTLMENRSEEEMGKPVHDPIASNFPYGKKYPLYEDD